MKNKTNNLYFREYLFVRDILCTLKQKLWRDVQMVIINSAIKIAEKWNVKYSGRNSG